MLVCHNVSWKQLPQVVLQIEGNNVCFLIDTGASSSSLNDPHFDTSDCSEGRSIGINGTELSHSITPPLAVATPQGDLLTYQKFAILPNCPVSLLGRDLMSALGIKIEFDKTGAVTATSRYCDLQSPKRSDLRGYFLVIPVSLETHRIWAENKASVGFINCTPYKPQLRPNFSPIYQKQYALHESKIKGITPQINTYLEQGILTPIISPWNTPIYPVRKASGEWRLVQDLRALNKAIEPLPPLVSDISFIFTSIPADTEYYTVIDLSNAFFSIPIEKGAQPLFAFSWGGQGSQGQLTWTRLPQGFVDSPAAFSMVLNESVRNWSSSQGSVLIQYVDDILLCSTTKKGCEEDSTSLLEHLAEQGHLASRKKVQWVSLRVEYLGCILQKGERYVSPNRVKALTSLTPPKDKSALLSFLGSIVYCRQWIPDCSYYDSILRPSTLLTAPKVVQWTEEMLQAFHTLLESLTQAPALGLMNYKKETHLYCVVSGPTFAAVLAQSHGSGYRPVAYISKKLPVQVQGMPACLQNIAVCAMAVQEASKIVLGHPMTLHTTHTVTHLLQNLNTQHMTTQRASGYEILLLNTAGLKIKYTPDTTPIVRMLHSLLKILPQSEPEVPHDCTILLEKVTSPRRDLTDVPLKEAEDVFVDGSCSRPTDHTFLTGYSVVQLPDVVLEADVIPGGSAQVAELTALTRACTLFKDKEVNIYTDSKYAYGVVHDFGVIWANRGFKTADNKNISNKEQVLALLEAIKLPRKISIVKVKAHTTDKGTIARGNALADKIAKEVALKAQIPATPTTVFFQQDFNSPDFPTVAAQMQSSATEKDVTYWSQQGLTKDHNGLWTKGRVIGIPTASAPLLLSYLHGPGHIGTKPLLKLYEELFCTSDSHKQAETLTQSCLTCAQNNVQGKRYGLHGVLPPPLGPLQDLQVDFTHMPTQKGNLKYLLVILDKWSGWVEAIPTTGETAKIAARGILNHWITRFGIPQRIWSDQGPAFTSAATQELAKILGIQWKLHIPYHPQSAGMVERMNRNIKDKLKKATQGTLKNWIDFLPTVLFQIRTTPHSKTLFSPFEILMGKPCQIDIPKMNSDEDINLYSLQERYVKELVSSIEEINEHVSVTHLPLSTEPTHPFIPGDKVLIKQLAGRKTTGPIFTGPWDIEKVSRTAVLTSYSPQWIHASRLKKSPNYPDTPDPPVPPPHPNPDYLEEPTLSDQEIELMEEMENLALQDQESNQEREEGTEPSRPRTETSYTSYTYLP